MSKLSIASALDERDRQVKQANDEWEVLAAKLQDLIPAQLRKFATEMGWIKFEIDGWWRLPEFLQSLVSNTRTGGCCDNSFNAFGLSVYGFKSFHDLREGMKALEQAWTGLIRIEVEEVENEGDDRVEVRFYSAEVTPTEEKE